MELKPQKNLLRREFLNRSLCLSLAGSLANYARTALAYDETKASSFQVHQWNRFTKNPILAPGENTFDSKRCMNPFVIKQNDEYWMFYAGADKEMRNRICLATAPTDKPTVWKRKGPILDLGKNGSFDEHWCVLPCIHKIRDKWHLYYTGRTSAVQDGLQSFGGIGVAVSDDLVNWKRYSDQPVLRGDGFEQWPNNQGIAGGGSIVDMPQADGKILYRMHYTLATGKPSKDPRIDQAKQSVVAYSEDGFEWKDRKVILQPRPDVDYENCGTIGLTIWKTSNGYRAIYAAIGTKFGAYSICEAESQDGLSWNRGKPGENLSLAPSGKGWESKMITYPNIVEEEKQLRLFYCGNGYGSTGIGMAVAQKLLNN